MMEPEQQTEVSAALKQLAKLVVRGFYGVEHALAMDVIIRRPNLREEDMLELLMFGPKQLHSVLNSLKGDKFVKCQMQVETAPDGKKTRHNHYSINSRMLVKVIRYKLDNMRKRLETEARESTDRASFRCPDCFSTFTDLDAGQLFDPAKQTFNCTCCQAEVEDNVSSEETKEDPRSLVTRFNEQMDPIYSQLREAENESRKYTAAASGSLCGTYRDAWSTKGSSYGNLYTQNVVISMGEQDQHRQASKAEAPKEQPIWLTQSTVQGAYCEPKALNNVADMAMPRAPDSGAAAHGKLLENEDMREVLFHESVDADNCGGGEDEEEEDDDDELEEEYMVRVGGREISYQVVSQKPELVGQMSAQEKEAYIKMGQAIYEAMYG